VGEVAPHVRAALERLEPPVAEHAALLSGDAAAATDEGSEADEAVETRLEALGYR